MMLRLLSIPLSGKLSFRNSGEGFVEEIVSMPEMMGLSQAGQQQLFIQQFNLQVVQPIKSNPNMLYKKYWESLKKVRVE